MIGNILKIMRKDEGEMHELNIVVPFDDTPRMQEMHIMIGHILCQAVDRKVKA